MRVLKSADTAQVEVFCFYSIFALASASGIWRRVASSEAHRAATIRSRKQSAIRRESQSPNSALGLKRLAECEDNENEDKRSARRTMQERHEEPPKRRAIKPVHCVAFDAMRQEQGEQLQ
jgi:hypothetical protein